MKDRLKLLEEGMAWLRKQAKGRDDRIALLHDLAAKERIRVKKCQKN